jgi:hypothetical protein
MSAGRGQESGKGLSGNAHNWLITHALEDQS